MGKENESYLSFSPPKFPLLKLLLSVSQFIFFSEKNTTSLIQDV